jgi:threonine/homoserine/homoserine lactone efflux protein
MGYLSIKAGNTQFDSESVNNQQGSLLTAARDGLFIVLFNPKIALFFAALLSQFIGSDLSWLDWVLLWAMISLIDGSCYTMITLLLSQPRTLQRLQRQGVWINRIIGLVLLSLSLRVLLTI